MKAITFDHEIKFHSNYPQPIPAKGEALIRVSMAGICNTDLEITKGYMSFAGVLGHEFVGVVEQINGGPEEWVARRVVGEINCVCNSCECCRSGLHSHCTNRAVLGISGKDGCFAQYITLPLRNLYRVPDTISDEAATFVEPLAAAFQIGQQIHIKSTDTVLVLGDGKLGLLIALALNLLPAQVVLMGRHSNNLAIVHAQGVETMMADESDILNKYDVVVDATGSSSGLEYGLAHVKPRGKLVLKSTVADSRPINLAPLVIDEVTLVGSRCGPFVPALRALEDGLIRVEPLISHIYKPDAFFEAFEKCRTKGVLKVLLDFRTQEAE